MTGTMVVTGMLEMLWWGQTLYWGDDTCS